LPPIYAGNTYRRRLTASVSPAATTSLDLLPCSSQGRVCSWSKTTMLLAGCWKRPYWTPGFSVRSTAHGAEALRLLDHETPNLIVLDLMLPWINGVEVLTTVRQQPRLLNVPIIVVTGTATTAFDLRAFVPLRLMRSDRPGL
jgi:CheY-like chemotaxis protein